MRKACMLLARLVLVPSAAYAHAQASAQASIAGTKVFRPGRVRTNVGMDLYNALNSAVVLDRQDNYGPNTNAWLTPSSGLAARFITISGRIEC